MGLYSGQIYVSDKNSFRIGDTITLTIPKSWFRRLVDWVLRRGKRLPLVVTKIERNVITLEVK